MITKYNHCRQDDGLSDEVAYLKGFDIRNDTVKQYANRFAELCKNPPDENLEADAVSDGQKGQAEKLTSLVVTSGFGFENCRMTNYFGCISSEVVIGLGVFKGVLVDVANVFQVESVSIENKLKEGKQRKTKENKKPCTT